MMKVSFKEKFNGEFIEEEKINLFYEIMSDAVVYVISKMEEKVEVKKKGQEEDYNGNDNGDVDVEENEHEDNNSNGNGDVDMLLARKKHAKRRVCYQYGTGVVIEPGLVLTAAHVIENTLGVTIRYFEDTDYYKCDVIAFDLRSDLALIKKKSNVGSKVHVKFGCSDNVKVGARVLTIAHPSPFSYSFSIGNIVHPHRRGTTMNVLGNATYQYPHIHINNFHNKSGSSGGPVFNSEGLLIGIYLFEADGFDFAAHVDVVKIFVECAKEDLLGKRTNVFEQESTPTLKQGSLPQRRSNSQESQFPTANDVARMAAMPPIHNGCFNRYKKTSRMKKPRVGVPGVWRRFIVSRFIAGKKQKLKKLTKRVPKQRPQTLESHIKSNMNEQWIHMQHNISPNVGVVDAQPRQE